MSILSRCAVRWGPSHTLQSTHCSRPFLLVPTNVHQPAVLGCHTVARRHGSPLAYLVWGRQGFSSRKIPRPSKQADALKTLRRERQDRNKPSLKGIGPVWARIAVFYAALTVILWGGATLSCLTLSEKTPVTGRRRFAYFSAPSPSGGPHSEEVKEALEQIEGLQGLFGPLPSMVRKVFMDIAVAAGVDDREWKVYIIPHPGQSSHIESICMLSSQTDTYIKRPMQQCQTRCRW